MRKCIVHAGRSSKTLNDTLRSGLAQKTAQPKAAPVQR